MKITVIGGGSTYTPELVNGFIHLADVLPVTELCLMDIDPERLEIVGGFAQRMLQAKGNPFKATLSTVQKEAIAGASYVVTQLRVGMMPARRGDEYLGLRHGLIGQETTGIGGLAKALRTIPVILSVADDIRELAPEAWLLNFTNPAGLVTEALARHAHDITSAGVCNVGITTKMNILDEIEKKTGAKINPDKAELDTLGLNHLTWHRGFKVDGEELWSMIFPAFLESLRTSDDPEWDAGRIEKLGMMPNYYLQYFYDTAKKLAEQKNWPPSRAEAVMEIEQQLLKDYSNPALTEPPDELMKRGGAYYSTLATQLIHSHFNDLGQTHVVNVRNNGAVKEWDADWVLELPAKVDRKGIHPKTAKPLPLECFELISKIKSFEIHAVEAAVHGDRASLRKALTAHPLGPSEENAEKVLNDLLETNKIWLDRFF